MNKILSIIALSFSLVFASNEVAIVKFIDGKLSIKRQESIILAKDGDKLQNGDILMTDSKSKAGIIFDDGSALTLNNSSYLEIKNFAFEPVEEKFDFSLQLDKGALVFESGKIGSLAPEKFELKIPNAVLGIRGTKFLVEIR